MVSISSQPRVNLEPVPQFPSVYTDYSSLDFLAGFIFFMARFYVYKCKVFGNGNLDVYEFLVDLKNKLKVEKMCCQYDTRSRRTLAIWQDFYDEL